MANAEEKKDNQEVIKVRITILPKTTFGRWSFGLGIAWILFFGLSDVLTELEVLGPQLNLAFEFALTTVATGIAGAALLTGLIGMIKSKERSILVFVAMVIGVLMLWGGLGSLLGLAKRL